MKKNDLLETISIIFRFLWFVSFVSWFILTFFAESMLSMWISLGFMWLFLIANSVTRMIIKRTILNKVNNYGLIKVDKIEKIEKNKKSRLQDYKKENTSYQK